MQDSTFQRLLASLGTLTTNQRRALEQALEQAGTPDDVLEIINSRAARCHVCPHCNATEAWRWGYNSGVQRYRCKQCRKTFNALTGTSLARLKRKDAWMAHAEAMQNGLTIRESAKIANVDVTTAFRWRHRMLKAPSQARDAEMDGIVEADETYFLVSFKGNRFIARAPRKRGGKAAKRGLPKEQIPVLIVRDRHGRHFDTVLPAVNKETLGVLLPQLLSNESVLCTDGAHVYGSVTKALGIPHESIRFGKHGRVKGRAFHIQHVNAYDSRLKKWMQRFSGVATKYLSNYLGWRRLYERLGNTLTPARMISMALG